MKRALDVVLSAVGIVILSPVLLIVAVLVRIRIGSPVLFRQVRPGLNAEPFELIKFRTMIAAHGSAGGSGDRARLTPFGAWLRSTSLDELPQLWNVLRGDMSLVGPRPLFTEYLELYSPEQKRRHAVLPGLTGWAQVSGRNAIGWPRRLGLDIWYVDNRTLWLDLRIILLTIAKILKREGISQEGEATVQPFRGNGDISCGH